MCPSVFESSSCSKRTHSIVKEHILCPSVFERSSCWRLKVVVVWCVHACLSQAFLLCVCILPFVFEITQVLGVPQRVFAFEPSFQFVFYVLFVKFQFVFYPLFLKSHKC